MKIKIVRTPAPKAPGRSAASYPDGTLLYSTVPGSELIILRTGKAHAFVFLTGDTWHVSEYRDTYLPVAAATLTVEL